MLPLHPSRAAESDAGHAESEEDIGCEHHHCTTDSHTCQDYSGNDLEELSKVLFDTCGELGGNSGGCRG